MSIVPAGAHFAAMVAQHVELALFELSLGNIEGLHRPFCDRMADAAEKTAGSVLFDVRVDGDICVQRLAAIGYGVTGTAIIVMDKYGQLIPSLLSPDS
ncbi:hypothetical protein NKH45_35640 [Mesorhizobium sp. M1156]|uniref:hypothetical protein n=1 Tax=Mesorhizobium sp. M1156 TaxID=2957064 RepID=UPI0033370C21